MKFKAKVTQICKITRIVEIEIDAVSKSNANYLIAEGEIEIPAYHDPDWKTTDNILMDEYTELV